MNKLEFLATPYFDPDPEVRKRRFYDTMDVLYHLIKAGHSVYSPIVHCHELAEKYALNLRAEDWRQFNFPFLARSDVLRIVKLPGWTDSRGLAQEWQDAEALGLEIIKMDPYL